MNKQIIKNQIKARRHGRVRVKVSGTASRPRLSVYRSLSHIGVQLIDDITGKTLASAKDTEIKEKGKGLEMAVAVGKLIAKKAIEKKIKEVVFDKGHMKFHGRVKAVADGAKEGGLKI